MRQYTFNKTVKLCLVIVGTLVIIWLGFSIYKAQTFHVISTNPAAGKVTEISPFFDINFSKSLSSRVTVSSTPNIINGYRIQGKQITTTLNIPLNPNQTYTINIHNIYDTKGKYMTDQKFVFSPKVVSSNNLPSDQNRTLLNNQSQYDKAIAANGLTRSLPFTEPNFEYRITDTVKSTTQGTQVTYQITAPNQQSQQAALDWISAQGYKPSKLNIQYITAQPSINSSTNGN